jgi:DNA-binding MarR family transcriptional regulator
MSEIAHHLGLEKSTMSGLVDRAEQRGLLARGQRDGDRRAIEVFLTPAGAELAGRGSVLIAGLLLPATDGLSPAERRRLQALLERTVARDDPDRARIN